MSINPDAFTELIRRHAGLIHKVAFAYCKNPADREDVVQDIAIQLWRARDRYDPAFRETTWIYRIAINVAISAYRRDRRHVERREPLDAERIIVEPIEIPPDVERLRAAIEALTPLERALVVLYLDDCDHTTIADVVGISPSNVGTKLHRIKEKLRHELDDLKAGWALLAKSVALNERLLRVTLIAKARRALWPYVVWRAIETVVGLAMLFAIAPVVAAHATEPRYLIAGGATLAFLAGVSAATVYLVVGSLRVNPAASILEMQRELARLKLVEYRSTMWAILGGVVVWLPLVLLGFEALTGVPALARVDLAYLAWNIVIGLAVLALGFFLARRFAGSGARRGKLVDALSGRSLQIAEAHLADLAQFTIE